jgi:DNA modification methylase
MSKDKTNKLICGDNLDELAKLPKDSIDLIYIDPPFFSQKQYEVVWGDEAEMRSFEDRWEGGIEHYIGWLKPRVQLMRDALKPTGSFYLHCDHHANAHIRIMLDEVFGPKNFQNEIIWHYRKWPSGKYAFQQNHDVILFYSKTNDRDRVFNQLYMPRAASTLKRFGTAKILSGYDESGERIPSKMDEQESKGVRQDDAWEFSRVPPIKRLYPTQKPEPLLERIIMASSNEGDVVLDAFCGCGTSCVVAHKLDRKWIGIDISPSAIRVVQERLLKVGARRDHDYICIGAPKTVKELKKLKPFEFQNWVIDEMRARHSRKKVGDMGIDGYILKDLYRHAAGIQVKQSKGVGRNVVDNFKSALDRDKYKKGYLVAFSFSKGALEEAARLRNIGDIDIILVAVEGLLSKTTLK